MTELQTYLRGEAVGRDGFSSRIEWFRSVKYPKVPVHVAATGPKVIELAGRIADGVALAVGADPEHVGRSIERARAAAKAAGRRPEELRVGAFVTAVAHADAAVARDAVRGAAATFARFSAFPGSPIATLPAPLREAAEFLRANYDMRAHTSNAAAHARAMSDAFVDWYAAAGTADQVLSRLKAVRDAGADFIYIVSGSADAPREVTKASVKLIASEIVPALVQSVGVGVGVGSVHARVDLRVQLVRELAQQREQRLARHAFERLFEHATEALLDPRDCPEALAR